MRTDRGDANAPFGQYRRREKLVDPHSIRCIATTFRDKPESASTKRTHGEPAICIPIRSEDRGPAAILV